MAKNNYKDLPSNWIKRYGRTIKATKSYADGKQKQTPKNRRKQK